MKVEVTKEFQNRKQVSKQKAKDIKRVLKDDYNMCFKGTFLNQAFQSFNHYWRFDDIGNIYDAIDFIYDNIDKFTWYLFWYEARQQNILYKAKQEILNK